MHVSLLERSWDQCEPEPSLGKHWLWDRAQHTLSFSSSSQGMQTWAHNHRVWKVRFAYKGPKRTPPTPGLWPCALATAERMCGSSAALSTDLSFVQLSLGAVRCPVLWGWLF